MTSTPMQTTTPLSLLLLPSKDALVKEFVGKQISSLRTPALIVDKKRFIENCKRVTGETEKRGMAFRAHVKTHKTSEGIRLQVEASNGVRALIAATMPEVWQIIQSGVVQEGKVDDILYSMPISSDKLDEITSAQSAMAGKGTMRLMVDHAAQIGFLDQYGPPGGEGKWSVFVKVDGGGKRAGCPPDSQQMGDLLDALAKSSSVEVFGFYSHFGQSYASKSLDKATEFYHSEIECVNAAAKRARSMGLTPASTQGGGDGKGKGKWTLSVGATPTAHAAIQIQDGEMELEGELELHAGCYCMLDIQQLATSLISHSDISISILARIVSTYPLRKEAMCDAGALAVSKDTGPLAGYGHVVWPESLKGWDLGRVSQEHGTLVRRPAPVGAGAGVAAGGQGDGEGENTEDGEAEIGDLVRIVPQHACLACACYPWYYVVEDGGEEIVDVWVPCKGW